MGKQTARQIEMTNGSRQASRNGAGRRGGAQAAIKTRDLILQTALKIVSREGLAGLTIGELAKAVGMSKSGLFAHFGGKDQLQLAVLELAVWRFVEIVLRPAFQEPRGEPRITAVFENWLGHLDGDEFLPGGSVLIAASTELDDCPGPLRDFVQNSQRDLISNIEKAAKMAIDEGHFHQDLDVEQFAWTLYSFVLGYHHFTRMLEDPKAEVHLKRSFKTLMAVARNLDRGPAKQRRAVTEKKLSLKIKDKIKRR